MGLMNWHLYSGRDKSHILLISKRLDLFLKAEIARNWRDWHESVSNFGNLRVQGGGG